MGVSSLPKTVRGGSDLNPGPSAPESSTLTTRLPSHLHTVRHRTNRIEITFPVSAHHYLAYSGALCGHRHYSLAGVWPPRCETVCSTVYAAVH